MQKTSLYQSVYTDLKSNILNKTYPIGTLIPTESELEDIYSVSRTTIRKAISLLVNEGLLSVKRRKGIDIKRQYIFLCPFCVNQRPCKNM